jgi:hypothetical protein
MVLQALQQRELDAGPSAGQGGRSDEDAADGGAQEGLSARAVATMQWLTERDVAWEFPNLPYPPEKVSSVFLPPHKEICATTFLGCAASCKSSKLLNFRLTMCDPCRSAQSLR